jgi:hypothetical protein
LAYKLQDLLPYLEEALDIDLHVDENGACKILLNDKIAIQLELDQSETHLVLGSFVTELSPGRFREMVLKGALRSNYGKEKGFGNLAFIPKTATLFLYESIPLAFFSLDDLFDYFHRFANKALMWKESLEGGMIPLAQNNQTSSLGKLGRP